MKLLYISLGYQPNDFYYSLCKYFDCQLYKNIDEAISFFPDIIHIHSGAISLEEANILKSKTKAIWTQFTGDCAAKPLEPILRIACDYTLLTIAEGMDFYKDCKNVFWMPEAITEPMPPKELTTGKIVFVGNYYDHFPQGNERKEMCQTLSKEYVDLFECYGNFNIAGVNCKGTIPYDKVAQLYNDSYIVIAHDNFTEVSHYFTQRYLLAMAVSCCVGKDAKDNGLDKACLVRYNNLEELKTSIEILYEHPIIRNRIAKAGHEYIKRNFTYDKWVERYLCIVQ